MASVAPTDKKALIPLFLKLCLSGCQMKAFQIFMGTICILYIALCILFVQGWLHAFC